MNIKETNKYVLGVSEGGEVGAQGRQNILRNNC